MLRFGDFTFRLDSRELLHNDLPVPLPPKASAVLDRLLRDAGRLVLREELHQAAWGDTIVEFDQSLKHGHQAGPGRSRR